MKNLKKKLITTAFLAVLTLSASLFTANNFPVQTVVAQSSVGSGPQDGGDGKKKKCRPPRECPTGNPNSNRQEAESSDWWDDFIDWLFGE